ncbi:PREDICTED: uncharacterized protein LOC104734091 [Camelina sativa]|uniref:Uncharacterized protein LOC104734091 n=1 Tax=Camelina sativa TaxID=90675 RepID=A0ABM0V6Z0_CAMSA|nr:PREDICTED: uncharacterized protein LOC104734091 [Camelina sativa]
MGSLLHRAVSSAPEIDRMFEATQRNLFTKRVLETYVPNVKIRLPTYDGTKDPMQHFTSFMATVSKARFTKEQKDAECNVSSAELWEIVQEPGEPLRQYLTQFKEKYATVTVAEDVAIAALKKGLIPGSRLHVDLNIREAKDLDEALHRGSRVAYVEEDEEKRATKPPPPRPAASKEKSRETYQEPQKHHDPRDPKRGVVNAISEDEGQSAVSPDTQEELYCNFHMFGGHSTAECKHLSSYLFEKYLSGEKKAPPPVEQQNPAPVEVLPTPSKQSKQAAPPGHISMIIGQTDECTDSVRALKKRARQICNVQVISEEEALSSDPITFTTEDAKGIHHPHNNPLVVEVMMGEFDVERVLVDTGSTVNVLFVQTLEKIGVIPKQIKPGARTLTGYDGVAKTSMGDVKLQVQTGGVTRKTKFVVIDAPPIYNAILASPWIYSMQAIFSTYHLCVKFPTVAGIYTLYGDQKMARTCSVLEKKQRRKDDT